jgi:hypothetical protein
MKSVLVHCFLFLLFIGCNSADKADVPTSENDVDAARNFIKAALEGHYDEARQLVVKDSFNTAWIDLLKRNYQEHMSLGDKAGYREASINIHQVQSINDSITVINYSNSFKKQADSLKIIRQKGAWLVDLRYSFPTSTDTLP